MDSAVLENVKRAVSPSTRLARIVAAYPDVEKVLRQMIDLSQRALPTMFRADQHEFAFTKRLAGRQTRLEGSSIRYGAITILGAAHLDESIQQSIFGGETAAEFCSRLIAVSPHLTNLGDVALIAWGSALLGHGQREKAYSRLKAIWPTQADGFTVEVAWTVSALAQARGLADVDSFAQQARRRLMEAFDARSALFGHHVGQHAFDGVRGHIGCFADQVYPIQALSRFHHVFGDDESLATASRCAAQICRLQGDRGQWWWHYDIRTGTVAEGYPVYSVHQNSMGPMALLDLYDAGGPDHAEAIRRSLLWMQFAPEVGRSLIDEDNLVIWRKAARNDPKKFVRKLRALSSWIHPALRFEWLNWLFPPRSIDFESRPYHLGWILHAWLGRL